MASRQPWPVLDPPYDEPAYRATRWRAPKAPLVVLPSYLRDRTGPVFGRELVGASDSDLTGQHSGEPQGQRIIVAGRLLDESGRPLAHQLIEVWQANAAGRYRHEVDRHPAPLDPNFSGAGRCLTGADGSYQFTTIRPGAYPWQNHDNAWRAAHIHFSVFGTTFSERLVTQMYFPGDPLMDHDPIYQAVREPKARSRLVADLDMDLSVPERALGFRWDIVIGRRLGTPLDDD